MDHDPPSPLPAEDPARPPPRGLPVSLPLVGRLVEEAHDRTVLPALDPDLRPAAIEEPEARSGDPLLEQRPVLARRLEAALLVVEDEPLILMSNVDMVEELGHEVEEASSAEDALKIMEQGLIDILLTDVGLPGMTGMELARTVRARWPDVKIIFASGDNMAQTTSGIDDALQLSKPFTLDALKTVLMQAQD